MGEITRPEFEAERDRIQAAVGKRLDKLCRARGMTHRELAAAAGLHQSDVTNKMKGKRMTNAHHLARLAKALGCSPSDLIPAEAVGLKAWPVASPEDQDSKKARSDLIATLHPELAAWANAHNEIPDHELRWLKSKFRVEGPITPESIDLWLAARRAIELRRTRKGNPKGRRGGDK